ncbi:MAG: hypothetical protein VX908_02355 [Planctomycetota bacterium]|nr:hypothetical protein [Planctomycetota bacterium]
MRWLVFMIAALLATALDLGLASAMTLRTLDFLTPSFAAVLVAYTALHGRADHVLWGAWVIGVLADLSPGSAEGAEAIYIIGPHALGYVFGASVILTIRSMVFRHRVLTLSACTFACVLSTGLATVLTGIIRFWLPFTGGAVVPFGLGELGHSFGDALYSGLLAIPAGWVLFQTMPLWRFDYGVGRRTA